MDQLHERCLSVFLRHHPPAATYEESDESFTTQDILDKFQELLGEEAIGRAKLCEMLSAKGYVFDFVEDGFRWLVKNA